MGMERVRWIKDGQETTVLVCCCYCRCRSMTVAVVTVMAFLRSWATLIACRSHEQCRVRRLRYGGVLLLREIVVAVRFRSLVVLPHTGCKSPQY